MKVQRLFASMSTEAARMSSLPRIAVVGRGLSGMMAAIALMKTLRTAFHLQLYDPDPSVSGGQALSAVGASSILNSRVRDLSVSLGEADDFNLWLSNNSQFRAAVPAAIPGFRQIFVPKQIFSDYVYERFSQSLALRRDITVQVCHDTVTAIRRIHNGRFLLESANAANPLFDLVLLATGYGIPNLEPEPSPQTSVRAQRLVGRPHTILLGSGIRVVDQLLQLRDAGYEGQVSIISRHGFLPQSHTPNAAEPVFPADAMPKSLPDIVRFIRAACREAEAQGHSWQSVMNGLRRHARGLWEQLPARHKHQFNRHLRAIYDSHRNRLPEAIHLRLARELETGRTTVRRGHILRSGINSIAFRAAGASTDEQLYAERVIDCRCRSPELASPLVRSLMAEGLAVADELALGVAVNEYGQPFRSDGMVTDGIFALGPLGLGSLPDIDLVPEIVSQAYAVAERVDAMFQPHSAAV